MIVIHVKRKTVKSSEQIKKHEYSFSKIAIAFRGNGVGSVEVGPRKCDDVWSKGRALAGRPEPAKSLPQCDKVAILLFRALPSESGL